MREKTHLATEKNVVLHHSLKINKGGVLIKIEKLISVPPFIRHLRVLFPVVPELSSPSTILQILN